MCYRWVMVVVLSRTGSDSCLSRCGKKRLWCRLHSFLLRSRSPSWRWPPGNCWSAMAHRCRPGQFRNCSLVYLYLILSWKMSNVFVNDSECFFLCFFCIGATWRLTAQESFPWFQAHMKLSGIPPGALLPKFLLQSSWSFISSATFCSWSVLGPPGGHKEA